MRILKRRALKPFMSLFHGRHQVITNAYMHTRVCIRISKTFSLLCNSNYFAVIFDETDCTIRKDGFEGWINSTEIGEVFPQKVENIMKLNLPLDCMFIIEVEESWKVKFSQLFSLSLSVLIKSSNLTASISFSHPHRFYYRLWTLR